MVLNLVRFAWVYVCMYVCMYVCTSLLPKVLKSALFPVAHTGVLVCAFTRESIYQCLRVFEVQLTEIKEGGFRI